MGARDCGFVSASQLIRIWKGSWSSWRKLETHKGHYFNWYETSELKTLPPRYVSTVDSGNLAACLLAWQVCLQEIGDQPIFHPSLLSGIADTLDCLIEDLRKAVYGSTEQTAGYTEYVKELLEQTEIVAKDIDALVVTHIRSVENGVDYVDLSLDQWTDLFRLLRSEILSPLQSWSLDVVSEWLRRKLIAFQIAIEGFEADLAILHAADPAIKSQPTRTITLQKLFTSFTQTQNDSQEARSVSEMLQDLTNLHRDAEVAFAEMDFKFLLNRKRKLFKIGYNLDTDRFDRSHYDMLASESRLGSYVAIGKGDAPSSHWFKLADNLLMQQDLFA